MSACLPLLLMLPRPDDAPLRERTVMAQPGNPGAGRLLLMQYQCGGCHHIHGVDGARGRRGPTLVSVERRSYIAGQVPLTSATLVRWIVDPAALVPGSTMPAMGVTPGQARDMAAWLERGT